MIVIPCPYCGEERQEDELAYGGEAEIVRSLDPSAATDEEWTNYLYFRNNPKGLHQEQWCCAGGCGQWFKVARHTVTHAVNEVVTYDRQLTEGGQK